MPRRLALAKVVPAKGVRVAPLVPVVPRPLFDSDVVAAETIARFADDSDFVTALARGLAVLLALSDKKRRMSIAQVSHRTGIPRATARRSLHTLQKLGFVAADDAQHFYLHEGCSLAILDGEEIVYLARSSSSRIMSPALNVGRRLPAYCTSIGQVLLAHLPARELDEYLAHARFYRYTDYTLTTVERLRETLEAIRAQGFAYASQQMELRLCTLAVPVRDAGGHYVAGMNVILQGRLLPAAEMAEQFFRPLHEASLELGSLLVG